MQSECAANGALWPRGENRFARAAAPEFALALISVLDGAYSKERIVIADKVWDLYITPAISAQQPQPSWYVYRGNPSLSCCVGIFSNVTDAMQRARQMAELFNRALPRIQVHIWEAATNAWRTISDESICSAS